MSIRSAACVMVIAIAVPRASAQAQPPHAGRILGVFDDATGQPVIGADVIDLASGSRISTSATGTVPLSWLGSGTTLLQVRKLGYRSRMFPVSTSAADTVPITIVLTPLAQTLPEVVTRGAATTTGKLATFEEHRAAGFGHFITQDVLDRNTGMQTAAIMMRMPGLTFVRGPFTGLVGNTRGIPSVLGARTVAGYCLAAVMVDGRMVYSGEQGEATYSVNNLRPEEIAGIEYYAGAATMPVAYNATRKTCGLVVIWTR